MATSDLAMVLVFMGEAYRFRQRMYMGRASSFN